MPDLAISSAAALTGANLASGDLFPALDVSAASGSKGSNMTPGELFAGLLRLGNTSLGTNVASGSINLGSVTDTTARPFCIEQTWNNASLTGTAFKVNVTATTAPNIASALAEFSIGNSRVMAVTRATFGGITTQPQLLGGGSFPTSLVLNGTNGVAYLRRLDVGWTFASGFQYSGVPADSLLGFSSNSSASNTPTGANVFDAFLMRGGAGHFKLGALHATTPTNQRVSGHNVTTGIGASVTVAGGTGGSCVGSEVVLGGGNSSTSSSEAILFRIAESNVATTKVQITATNLALTDGVNLSFGTMTGSQIGGSSEKLAFWGATPITRPARVSDSSGDAGTGSDTVDLTALNNTLQNIHTAIAAINSVFASTGLTAAS